jgi:hypothetical protein
MRIIPHLSGIHDSQKADRGGLLRRDRKSSPKSAI